MSLAVLADHLARKGRNGDTMLVHMSPQEVQGLHALALAHGGHLTINPETGLVEASWLSKLLPAIAGFALNAFLPGVGSAIGAALGGIGSAAGTAIAVGGITGLATGSLEKGLMAGLGAYGGAGLSDALLGGGAGATGVAGALGVPGAATGVGSQAAMLAEQNAGFGAEGLKRLAESAGYAQGATPSFSAALGAGAEAAKNAPAAFLKNNFGALAAAASPIIADAMVPTATKMPTLATSTPYLRPMIIDRKPAAYTPLTGSSERKWFETTYEVPPPTNLLTGQRLPAPTQTAATPGPQTTTPQPNVNYPPSPYDQPYLGGMAGGGLVAFADGGGVMNADNKAAFDYLTGGLSGESKAAYDYLMGAAPTVHTPEAPVRRTAQGFAMPRTVETDGGQVTSVGNTNTAAGTVDLGQSGGAGLSGNLNNSGIDQTNLGGVSFGNTPVTTGGDFNPIVNTGAIDFKNIDDSVPTDNTKDIWENAGPGEGGGTKDIWENAGPGEGVSDLNSNVNVADKTVGGLDTLYSNVTNNAVDNTTTNAGNPTINTNPAGTTGGLDTLYSNVTNTSAGGNAVDTTGNFDVYPDNTGLRDYGRMGAMGDMDMFAAGGMPMTNFNLGGYSDGGRLLKGPGDGVSDSIPATIGHSRQPARLADGEFVIPARIVSELGNGSTEAGARQLYAMMDRIQKARSKTVGKGRVAKDTRAEKYLPV